MFAVQHLLRQPIALAVRIMTEPVEVPFDAQAGGSTEIINQRQQFICVPAPGDQGIGSGAGRRDGEQLRTDVNEPAEQYLLAFELRAIRQHGVKKPSRQPATGARRVSQMPSQDWMNFEL